MRQSVQSLEQFYGSRLGAAARSMVARRLDSLWSDMSGCDVLGYGYGIPYLHTNCQHAHSLVYAMPADQGAARQMGERGNVTVLSQVHRLPFAPCVFDRVLVAHGLEEAPRLQVLLEDLWRVLKPEGRIVIIAANRVGLWARSEHTPFGAGRPFSRTQLSGALKSSGFVPLVRSGALYAPPVKFLCKPRIAGAFEKFGETVWPGFSGLVLVEAVKRLYAGRKGKEKKRLLRPGFGQVGALGTSNTISRSYTSSNTLYQDYDQFA